ncbi:RNA polymerase-associated protein CTR9 [Diplonema papillatum]|nr:RNA polymerase-associated protein CTR9 [Diplonema papillatum]
MKDENEKCHIVEVPDPDSKGSVVDVPLSLSTEIEHVLRFLESSHVHYGAWLDTAVFFFENKMVDKFEAILTTAISRFEKTSADSFLDRNFRCECCCSLAGYRLQQHSDSPGDKDMLAAYHKYIELAKTYDRTHPWVRHLEICAALVKASNSAHLNSQQKEQEYKLALRQLEALRPGCKDVTQRTQVSMTIAVCRYFLEDYVAAWKEFADIVAMTPGTTPNGVRLGLAYCNFKLGQEEVAIKTFRRAVEVEPTHTRALLGLAGALLGYQGDDAVVRHREGIERLHDAYRLNNRDPLLLNMFSSSLFRKYYVERKKNIADNISSLSTTVLRLTENLQPRRRKTLEAEANYQLGRVEHTQRNFIKADKRYKKALEHDPDHLLALYNRAQCIIYNRLHKSVGNQLATSSDVDEVLNLLKRCFQLVPDNADLLSIMSKLNTWKYMAVDDRDEKHAALEEAIECLHKITEVANPQDGEAWALRGYLEKLEPNSHSCLEEQVRTLESTNKPVSSALLNNLAALYLFNNELDKAAPTLARAAARLKDEMETSDTEALEATNTVLSYNTALFDEKQDKLEEATAKHVEIIKTWPGFLDSYIALADLYERLGYCKKAASVAELARHVMTGADITATSLPKVQLAAVLGRIGHWKTAMRYAKEVSAELARSEHAGDDMRDIWNFALLIEGNACFSEAGRNGSVPEKRTELLARAEGLYRQIHEVDPDNAYAVHNLACCLAAKSPSNVDFCKEMLERVKEANVPGGTDLDNVATFNLAQCFFLKQLPTAAVPLYRSLSSKVEQEPSLGKQLPIQDLPSKIAHSLVHFRDFRTAVRGFSEAAQNMPQSITMFINVALATVGAVLQDFRDDKIKTIDDMDFAEAQLDTAVATLQRLSGDLIQATGADARSFQESARAFGVKIKKHLDTCETVRKLMAEERKGLSIAMKHVMKSAEEFDKSATQLTTWRERQQQQKEATRREEEREKQRKMEEQERRLQMVNDDFVEVRNAIPISAAPKPKQRGSVHVNASETAILSSGGPADDSAEVEMEFLKDRVLEAPSLSAPAATSSGRKRKVVEITADMQKEIDAMSDGSDGTYEPSASSEGDHVLSDAASSDNEEKPAKKAKTTAGGDITVKEKKAKKSKKDKKDKKGKKEKKGKKDKKSKKEKG